MPSPLTHHSKAIVDLLKRHGVGDQRVDLDFVIHVPIDYLGDVGAATRATERGTAPRAPSDQLEGTRRDLLTTTGNADDDRFTPAFVASIPKLRASDGHCRRIRRCNQRRRQSARQDDRRARPCLCSARACWD